MKIIEENESWCSYISKGWLAEGKGAKVEESDEACNNGMTMKRGGLMDKGAEAGDRK